MAKRTAKKAATRKATKRKPTRRKAPTRKKAKTKAKVLTPTEVAERAYQKLLRNPSAKSAAEILGQQFELDGTESFAEREAMENLLKISRGAPGYRGRHIGDRLRATQMYLEMVRDPGKGGSGAAAQTGIIALVTHLRDNAK